MALRRTGPSKSLYTINKFRDKFSHFCKKQEIIYYFRVNGSIGIVQKIDFDIRPDLGCTTLKTSRKVVFDKPSVCLSVCPSVCLSDRLFFVVVFFASALAPASLRLVYCCVMLKFRVGT